MSVEVDNKQIAINSSNLDFTKQKNLVSITLKKINWKIEDFAHLTLREAILKDVLSNKQYYDKIEHLLPKIIQGNATKSFILSKVEKTHVFCLQLLFQQNLCLDKTLNEILEMPSGQPVDPTKERLSIILDILKICVKSVENLQDKTTELKNAYESGLNIITTNISNKTRQKTGKISQLKNKTEKELEKQYHQLINLANRFVCFSKGSINLHRTLEKSLECSKSDQYFLCNKFIHNISYYNTKMKSFINGIITLGHMTMPIVFVELANDLKKENDPQKEDLYNFLVEHLYSAYLKAHNSNASKSDFEKLISQTSAAISSEMNMAVHIIYTSAIKEFVLSLAEFENVYGRALQNSAEFLRVKMKILEQELNQQSELVYKKWMEELVQAEHRMQKNRELHRLAEQDKNETRSLDLSESESCFSDEEKEDQDLERGLNFPSSNISLQDLQRKELCESLKNFTAKPRINEVAQCIIECTKIIVSPFKRYPTLHAFSHIRAKLAYKTLVEVKMHGVQLGTGLELLQQGFARHEQESARTIIAMMILDMGVQLEQLLTLPSLHQSNELCSRHSLWEKSEKLGIRTTLTAEAQSYLKLMDKAFVEARYPWTSLAKGHPLFPLLTVAKEGRTSKDFNQDLKEFYLLLKRHFEAMREIGLALQLEPRSKIQDDLLDMAQNYFEKLSNQNFKADPSAKKQPLAEEFRWIKEEKKRLEINMNAILDLEDKLGDSGFENIQKALTHLKDIKEHLVRLNAVFDLITFNDLDPVFHAWLFRSCLMWQFAFEKSYQAELTLKSLWFNYDHHLLNYTAQLGIVDEQDAAEFSFNRGVYFPELTANTVSDTAAIQTLRKMEKMAQKIANVTSDFKKVGAEKTTPKEKNEDTLELLKTLMRRGNVLMEKRLRRLKQSFAEANADYSALETFSK